MSKPLTGPQIHAAYNQAMQDDKQARKLPATMVPIRIWNELYPNEKQMYDYMAKYLNTLLAQQEEGTP